ncbi:unnamed protein product [Mytilus coruscus]|uniref:Mab-21-like HhH/H2TH-like domain-containing protein n=1 Tax=Mytilus coruscus TaxID=42192 RepID=A0A6J8BKG2_MYTCO|nr:unnamed protein product [Mytilus coruscus]
MQTKTSLKRKKENRNAGDDCYSKDFCACLSKSLDLLGYSQDMIQYRREKNKQFDEIHNSKGFSVINVTAGGKDPNHVMIDINGLQINKQDKIGPAARYGNTFTNYDFVLGFECFCPDLIEKWVRRSRHHGWPDPDLIKIISTLEGHVVPVANKGSNFPVTEWRICYTKAELLLMQSLTDSQTKLYVLLKLITKSLLHPLCSAMTSYIMKNVVLWMVETNPKETFSQNSLIDKLLEALLYLKQCLQSNILKSYMIAERNLLEGRIPENERKLLLKRVDEMINERENLLQHCTKIHLSLNKMKDSPEDFIKEAMKRDEIEKLVLKKNIIFKETESTYETAVSVQNLLNQNATYVKYEEQLQTLIIPDKKDFVKQGDNCDDIFRCRLFNILS